MRSQWLVRAGLIVWASSLTVVGACLMAGHWIPLPTPPLHGSQLETILGSSAAGDGRWAAYHFLYADCPCSRRVFEHILAQSPREGLYEQIILIGGDNELAVRAQQRGYRVEVVSPIQLESQYGIEAAPLFVVVDPRGKVRYTGGYTSRKQGFDNQYNRIVVDLLAGIDVDPLPVYGCAVSRGLKSIVDPLGIKSSTRK